MGYMGFGMRREFYTRDSHEAFKRWKKPGKNKSRKKPPLPRLSKEGLEQLKIALKQKAFIQNIKLLVMFIIVSAVVLTMWYIFFWK